ILLILLPTQARENRFSSFIADSLDTYIQNGMKEWEIPGLSIGVVKDGGVIFSKGYGIRDLDEKQPVTSETLFMIGSLTKAITCATTVLACIDDSLSLNDPIQKWIPEFRLSNDAASKQVIVEDILTGRTGLGSHQGDFLFWKTNHNVQHLLKILPKFSLQSEIRRKFIYNNLSYLIIDELLNRSLNMQWSEAVRHYVFTPLKMNSSFAISADIPQGTELALPHLRDNSKLTRIAAENIDNMGPAGSISSNVKDMCRWMMAFMDMGSINQNEVLPTLAMKTLRKPYQLRGYRPRKDNADQLRFFFSGMGWSIHDEFDQLTYFHDGGTDGFKSYLVVIPEKRFGVVILTNSRSHNFAQAIADELQYAIHNQPFQSVNREYLNEYQEEEQAEISAQAALQQELTSSKPIINHLTGMYSNPLYGEVRIEKSEISFKLCLLSHQNNLTGKLYAIEKDLFWCIFDRPEFAPLKITFTPEDDSPLRFKLSAESSGFGAYVFTRVAD
ncbi:MAG: serine hydrolase domain-containing protein, partial [Calditrichota bacterium]